MRRYIGFGLHGNGIAAWDRREGGKEVSLPGSRERVT